MEYNFLHICRYQFEFLSSSPLPTVLSGIEFQNRLSELLTERSKVDTIFDFVDNCTNESKRQSPEFIKELMTAVCQCVFIGEIEEKRFGDVKNHFTNYVPVCSSNYNIALLKMLGSFRRPVHTSTTNAHTSYSGQSFLRDIYLRDIYLLDIYLRDIYLRDIYLRDIYLRDIYLLDIYLRDIYLRKQFIISTTHDSLYILCSIIMILKTVRIK